jgi:hypothetical protein
MSVHDGTLSRRESRMEKCDNLDHGGGSKPGPPNQPKHIWDTNLKQLSLQRDRTQLICHRVVIVLFLKSNINFIAMGYKSVRQPNNPEERHFSFEQKVEL